MVSISETLKCILPKSPKGVGKGLGFVEFAVWRIWRGWHKDLDKSMLVVVVLMK